MKTVCQPVTAPAPAAELPTRHRASRALSLAIRRWWRSWQDGPVFMDTLASPQAVAVPDWQIPACVRKARSGDAAGQWVYPRR